MYLITSKVSFLHAAKVVLNSLAWLQLIGACNECVERQSKRESEKDS